MKMLISFCLLFTSLYVYGQGGKVYVESNCASGGEDYYFFDSGDVVIVSALGESVSNEHISVGTWEKGAAKNSVTITLEYAKYIKPAPDANVVLPVGSKTQYDKYVAVYEKVSQSPKTLILTDEQDEGCAAYKNHSYSSSDELIDACLRNKGKRQYAFVSYRSLNESELQKYSAQELRIMHNEIYASYGYLFKDEKLKNYFQSRGFYGNMANVDAFLNDFEKYNIKLIKNAEKQKQ